MSLYCLKLNCSIKQCNVHPDKAKTDREAKYRNFEGNVNLCIKPEILFADKPMKKPKADELPVPTEGEEQEALFEWADRLVFKYPELTLLHHIPNEGKRSEFYGARLKREGMKTGVPDIHLPVARGKYHSLYIELKRIRGSVTTEAQKTWQKLLLKYGNAAYICYGWEEARERIEEYLKISE